MADITDLTQNVSIHDDTTDAAVTTTTDGAKQRLDMIAKILGAGGSQISSTTIGGKELLDVNASADPTQYHIEGDINVTGTLVTSAADVTLFTTTTAGVIDFVAVNSAVSSGFEIALFIDGVEKLRTNMTDLGSTLGLTGGSGEPVWTQTANKQFRWNPQGNAGFTSSFAIKAKATGSNVTLTHLILYRELQ